MIINGCLVTVNNLVTITRGRQQQPVHHLMQSGLQSDILVTDELIVGRRSSLQEYGYCRGSCEGSGDAE